MSKQLEPRRSSAVVTTAKTVGVLTIGVVGVLVGIKVIGFALGLVAVALPVLVIVAFAWLVYKLFFEEN